MKKKVFVIGSFAIIGFSIVRLIMSIITTINISTAINEIADILGYNPVSAISDSNNLSLAGICLLLGSGIIGVTAIKRIGNVQMKVSGIVAIVAAVLFIVSEVILESTDFVSSPITIIEMIVSFAFAAISIIFAVTKKKMVEVKED